MKKALGKKELLEVVPLSMSSIETLEKDGQFPKRFWLTDKRCAWNGEEVEKWLDERQASRTMEFTGKKPPVNQRNYRPVLQRAS